MLSPSWTVSQSCQTWCTRHLRISIGHIAHKVLRTFVVPAAILFTFMVPFALICVIATPQYATTLHTHETLCFLPFTKISYRKTGSGLRLGLTCCTSMLGWCVFSPYRNKPFPQHNCHRLLSSSNFKPFKFSHSLAIRSSWSHAIKQCESRKHKFKVLQMDEGRYHQFCSWWMMSLCLLPCSLHP